MAGGKFDASEPESRRTYAGSDWLLRSLKSFLMSPEEEEVNDVHETANSLCIVSPDFLIIGTAIRGPV